LFVWSWKGCTVAKIGWTSYASSSDWWGKSMSRRGRASLRLVGLMPVPGPRPMEAPTSAVKITHRARNPPNALHVYVLWTEDSISALLRHVNRSNSSMPSFVTAPRHSHRAWWWCGCGWLMMTRWPCTMHEDEGRSDVIDVL
jgi:hypothetical protein